MAEEKEAVKVPKEFKDLVEKIETLTVLELAELVKVLEKKFGVSAAAPTMVMGVGAQAGGGDATVEESATVNVELADGGSNKIAVIKALREVVPDLGLKDAKDIVDGAPKVVREGISRKEGEEVKKKLEEAGAKVNLK